MLEASVQEAEVTLAQAGARAIVRAYEVLVAGFADITRRARSRFERQEWRAGQQDSVARLDLYLQVVTGAVVELQVVLGRNGVDRGLWRHVKSAFSQLLAGRLDVELGETFYNSVARRFFPASAVDPKVMFVDSEFDRRLPPAPHPVFRSYHRTDTTRQLIAEILRDLSFDIGFRDLEDDARRAAERVDAHLAAEAGGRLDVVEVLCSLFYRNKGAYLVGRIRAGDAVVPLVLPLLNQDGKVAVDAVLLEPDEASIVFSFTRSYFLVEAEKPRDLIDFLHTIMPAKRVAELYIAIGYNKHGKTELYRDLMRHLARSDDPFVIASGERGMVMTVFTLPSYEMVFKVIKDSFAYPKTVTRREVRQKYRLVFTHDRVGRLVDALEFEHLVVARSRFSDELLDELRRSCTYDVDIGPDEVVLKHVYTERRLRPLNLYLQEVGDDEACDAVLDYGNAIKDMVSANIFPGDVMLKNFGVTRHGRVVFYDYDELCLITDCNFREIPPAHDFNEELYADTYFAVGENDVFPEEFETFLGLQGKLREVYCQAHGDLFRVAFWQERQEHLRAGEVGDVFPYKERRRLRT